MIQMKHIHVNGQNHEKIQYVNALRATDKSSLQRLLRA